MNAWPQVVWRSEWFAGLDAAARATIESAGDLRSLERGEAVCRRGEPADSFFVVVDGVVEVSALRRGDFETKLVRRAAAGDAVGEEAMVRTGVTRSSDAVCATRASVARVPVAIVRRERARAGLGVGMGMGRGDVEERLRVTAARDLLRTSSLARVVDPKRLDALAPLATSVELARGDVLFAQGDPVVDAFVVGDGMVAVETEDDGRTRIRAYLGRGDLVAASSATGAPHATTARACGPVWLVKLPSGVLAGIEATSPGALAEVRRIGPSEPLPAETRHLLGDLWRFAVAGSMLVIDDAACVRCGACAWSCADAHADGVSRLVRRGEKVRVHDASDGSSRALVVPGSCQHCKHPACMVDCPTGAIGRNPRGDVFVREDLCIGCGNCERACPWGSVHMAPRVAPDRKRLPIAVGPSPQVAVKCDLCVDRASGPACVASCPTDAIARIDPQAAIADVRRAPAVAGTARTRREGLPSRRPAWPWSVGAGILAVALARFPVRTWSGSLASGLAAGVLLALLVGHSWVKRSRWRERFSLGGGRVQTIAHGAIGLLAIGAVGAHVAGRVHANVAGAALVAFVLASITGIAAALAYAFLPPALARVERDALLPEDLPARARSIEHGTFAALSGRSDATKALYARVLGPMASSWLGAPHLVASGRSLREEEARVRRRVDAVVGARAGAGTLDGIDDLVRLTVERRAVRAQRLLQGGLRACVPLHVVAVAIAVTLVALHVVCELAGTR
jgi:Fe-S-cluster-containing dehydrogenase component/CRP-like cAMP-binding protein